METEGRGGPTARPLCRLTCLCVGRARRRFADGTLDRFASWVCSAKLFVCVCLSLFRLGALGLVWARWCRCGRLGLFWFVFVFLGLFLSVFVRTRFRGVFWARVPKLGLCLAFCLFEVRNSHTLPYFPNV